MVEIQYKEVVCEKGNRKAIELMDKYFYVTDSYWRGIGVIKNSALKLKTDWAHRDAEKRYDLFIAESKEPAGCRCGDILKGIKTPLECPLFGRKCTPEHPIGACMVSSEGSCSVYYKYNGAIR